MDRMALLTMSSKELNRLDIVKRVERKELTQEKAAKILKISDRQMRRLMKKYYQLGDIAVISKHRNKKSNRAFTPEYKQKILQIIIDNYYDFGPTFAAEKLLEVHNITINHETLRLWMVEAGIRELKCQNKTTVHQTRLRRACFGELVQIDGSHHDWFEGRGEECCLYVAIDDATSSLLALHFEPEETTQGYFRLLKKYFAQYGMPLAFYSDRDSIFRVNQPTVKENAQTQFQLRMNELNIELICANSSQAKGRVERANRTLQDRLLKELRLGNISTIEEANKYLPEFIEQYNKKFAKLPRDSFNMHRALKLTAEELNCVLAEHATRKLSKNLEFSYNGTRFQIKTPTKGYRLQHAAITIIITTSNQMKVMRKGKLLEFQEIAEQNLTTIASHKEAHAIVDDIKKKYIPPANHVWRQYPNTIH